MKRREIHLRRPLSAAAVGGCERNKTPRFVSGAHQNESLKGIKDGKVILPAWLGTCALLHRCLLFTGAALDLHARGCESAARRAESQSQKAFFKVGRSERYCIDQLPRLTGHWQWTPITHSVLIKVMQSLACLRNVS